MSPGACLTTLQKATSMMVTRVCFLYVAYFHLICLFCLLIYLAVTGNTCHFIPYSDVHKANDNSWAALLTNCNAAEAGPAGYN